MSHLGLVCPELSGHLNPLTTLGRELQRRGHCVTVVARPDARLAAGICFRARRTGNGQNRDGRRE